jgi:hypothetical protein
VRGCASWSRRILRGARALRGGRIGWRGRASWDRGAGWSSGIGWSGGTARQSRNSWSLRTIWSRCTASVALCLLFWGCGSTHVLPLPVANDCDTYCALMFFHCQGANAQFNSEEACQAACQNFPRTADTHSAAGNTLQCRMNFLIATTPLTARTFCIDASASGGSACR